MRNFQSCHKKCVFKRFQHLLCHLEHCSSVFHFDQIIEFSSQSSIKETYNWECYCLNYQNVLMAYKMNEFKEQNKRCFFIVKFVFFQKFFSFICKLLSFKSRKSASTMAHYMPFCFQDVQKIQVKFHWTL